MQAGIVEGLGLIAQQNAVGGHGNIFERRYLVSRRISRGKSRRISGSPPVKRILSTPISVKSSVSVSISSKRKECLHEEAMNIPLPAYNIGNGDCIDR